MRYIIVHNHLFKNAGTTFDWALQRTFDGGFLDHRDDEKMMTGRTYLGPFLQENKHLQAISTHHLKFPLPEIDGVSLLHAMFLRHPLDRIGSVYSFERKQDAQTLGAKMAKQLDCNDYVKWRMRKDIPGTIRHFQICRCLDSEISNKASKTEINESIFQIAVDRLKSTELLGVVDMFDESMVLIEEYLRPIFPNIDLAYVKQNRSRGRDMDLATRVKKLLERLDIETLNSAILNNHFDLKLYVFAKHLINERMKKFDDFPKRVEAFRKRCEILAN